MSSSLAAILSSPGFIAYFGAEEKGFRDVELNLTFVGSRRMRRGLARLGTNGARIRSYRFQRATDLI
jgi:hypothetical protein